MGSSDNESGLCFLLANIYILHIVHPAQGFHCKLQHIANRVLKAVCNYMEVNLLHINVLLANSTIFFAFTRQSAAVM